MTRASWTDTGVDGSLLGNKDEKDRATWNCFKDDNDTR